MKLLKKSAVSSELAQQKKNQIDEGVRIASKVDALRQSLASLESQEREFISGMQSRLRAETDHLHREIESLKSEILSLEEKRALLLIPLDAERESVRSAKSENDSLRSKIDAGLRRISDKESKMDLISKESRSRLSNIKVRERELEKTIARAIENVDKAGIERSESERIKAESESHYMAKNKEFLAREAAIASREREIEIEHSHIRDEKEEIIMEKAQLASQRSVLERALKRTRNV